MTTCVLRWAEMEADDTSNIPMVVIYNYGEATYFKLQAFRNGKWNDISIEWLPLTEDTVLEKKELEVENAKSLSG